MSTHENSRQRRHVRADLPLRAPRRGSGKYETIPFHPPPPEAPVKHGFGGSRLTRLVALTSFGFIVGLCRFRRLIAVLQLLYTETTPQSGFFLKKKPPSIESVRTYVLENRSSLGVVRLREF